MRIFINIANIILVTHVKMVELSTDDILLAVYFLLPKDVISLEGLRHV